jgi:hypothetical protein
MKEKEKISYPRYLKIEANPRYLEDTYLNEKEDEKGEICIYDNTTGMLDFIIDMVEGKILGWDNTQEAKIHYKIVDEGKYYLIEYIAQYMYVIRKEYYSCYVVDELLVINDKGYGDYMIMEVDKDGYIKNYPSYDMLIDFLNDNEKWEIYKNN